MKSDDGNNERIKESPQGKGGMAIQKKVEKEDFEEWMVVDYRQ